MWARGKGGLWGEQCGGESESGAAWQWTASRRERVLAAA